MPNPVISQRIRLTETQLTVRKMSFLLLNPLKTPGSREIPYLLGRFVLDRSDPMLGGYAPEDPSTVVEPFIDDELVALNGEVFVSRLASDDIKAAVRKVIQVAVKYEKSSSEETAIDSVKITRKRLKQARKAFDSLIDKEGIPKEVRKLMKRANTSRAWMITGILTAKDATIESKSDSTNRKAVSMEFEVPAEATVVAPELAPIAGSKLGEVEFEANRQAGSKLKATIEGERVFAVEYWRCESPSMLERLRSGPSLRERGPAAMEPGQLALGSGGEEDSDDADDFTLALTEAQKSLPNNDDISGIVFEVPELGH